MSRARLFPLAVLKEPTSKAAMTSPRAERLQALLEAAFSPASLTVLDESARHAGHAGARPGGQTHYAIHCVAAAFEGLSRVARHRAVNEAVRAEFETGLHALALTLRTPAEEAVAGRGAGEVAGRGAGEVAGRGAGEAAGRGEG